MQANPPKEGIALKIGLGFHPRTFTDDNLAFAKQLGVSHIMVHIPTPEMLPSSKDGIWSCQDLLALRTHVEGFGLQLEAIENFQPAHWYKILLDRPDKAAQMENIKTIIRNMGKAGIPIMGYNFSIAAVAGRKNLPKARGGAVSPVFNVADMEDFDTPIPHGYAWGAQVEENPPPGDIGEVTLADMWARYDYFLDEILPVAEEAGVKMAIHPDDPPMQSMRRVSRIMVTTERYDESFQKHPSPANMVEFCQGTFAEMPYGDDYVYDAIDHFTAMNKIAYVHFRNVRGKLPTYYEEFIDTGDVDMLRAMKIYKKNNYTGMIIPDHVPQMRVGEPWAAGVAYAIGYMRALCKALDIPME